MQSSTTLRVYLRQISRKNNKKGQEVECVWVWSVDWKLNYKIKRKVFLKTCTFIWNCSAHKSSTRQSKSNKGCLAVLHFIYRVLCRLKRAATHARRRLRGAVLQRGPGLIAVSIPKDHLQILSKWSDLDYVHNASWVNQWSEHSGRILKTRRNQGGVQPGCLRAWGIRGGDYVKVQRWEVGQLVNPFKSVLLFSTANSFTAGYRYV